MIRLLIVDDESATRNGLLRHVDWKALGIDMIQAAGSAQEALALCGDFQPDLVLSDIRMRGMNGVEMCKVLHREFPGCRIVFISGYSDKEYLKAAIELGAVDYVEKPVKIDAVQGAVQKAVDSIREELRRRSEDEMVTKSAAYLKRETFFALLSPPEEPAAPQGLGHSSRPDGRDEELLYRAEENGLISRRHPFLRVCVLHTSGPVTNISRFKEQLWQVSGLSENGGAGCGLSCEFRDNRGLLLLLCGTRETIGDESPSVRALERACGGEIEGLRLFLALGRPVREPGQLPQSYESAREAEKTVFLRGYGQFSGSGREERQINLDGNLPEEFHKALTARDEAGVRAVLDRLAVVLREGEAVLSAFVQGLYFSLGQEIISEYARLYPESPEKLPERREALAQKLGELDTLDSLNSCLMEQVHEMLENSGRDENNCHAVQQVLRLIQQNYGDRRLSIKWLAEKVYLTPTYLSWLFKRQMGKTIGEYLTSVRMEQAKELLRDQQFKLYHVAEQVGYEDAGYFGKIFKKQTGLTPSEYRERNLP